MVPRTGGQKFQCKSFVGPAKQTSPAFSFPKLHIIYHYMGYVPARGPRKFQRRSCTGIFAPPQDGPPKFRQGFADKSDEVSSSIDINWCAITFINRCSGTKSYGKISFRLYGKNGCYSDSQKRIWAASYLPGGDPQLLLFVQVAATVGWRRETCLETRFNLHRPICRRYVCMIGFDSYVYSKMLCPSTSHHHQGYRLAAACSHQLGQLARGKRCHRAPPPN